MQKRVYTCKEDFLQQNSMLQMPLPFTENLSILSAPLTWKNKTIPNRLACQAMEGCDGTRGGCPDILTIRRYDRLANGGAGLIWFEATAVMPEARANPRQLYIHPGNVDDFKREVERIKETAIKASGYEPLVIMQATHSGRYSKPEGKPAPLVACNNPIYEKNAPLPAECIVTDEYLDRVKEALIGSAKLAETAGFDGVDIKACHRYLNSELLSAYTRPGRYGGNLENRTRLLRESIAGALESCGSDFLVTSRLNVHDGIPRPFGFGMAENGKDFDPTEPIWLLQQLRKLGVELVNITMGNPYFNPYVNRPYTVGSYEAPEAPLVGIERMLQGTAQLKQAVPDMKLLCSAMTFLGTVAPNVAAAFIENGGFDLAGFGRTIFAYPDFAKDILTKGGMDTNKICICCSKCTEIMRTPGGTPGCVIHDRDVYLPLHKALCGGSRK